MKRLLRLFLILSVGPVGLVRPVSAQWPPDSIVNLQVLPEDIPLRQLLGIMRGFASGLGVQCIYCHVGDDPDELATTDFPSDDRIQKRKAREMIRMVRTINDELLAAVPERSDPPVRVTCTTCHHGVTKPVDIRDILADRATSDGADSAIAEYERLREEYYGSASYDFQPFMLANVAEQIGRQEPETALALLEYNLTRYPTDQQTFLTMVGVYMVRGDRDSAMAAVERGLAADPGNAAYQQVLERLRGN